MMPSADTAGSTTLHEVKTLILSFHPIIVFETVEEDRVDSLVNSVASDLNMPVFHWTLTKGLLREGQKAPFHGTDQPLGLLKYLRGLTVEGIFLLKDFAYALEDAQVRRQFREIAQSFTGKHSTIVLTGESVTLPTEVSHLAVHLQLRLPTLSELRPAVRELLQSLRVQQPFRIELSPDELEDLLRALSGLTLKQARQILAYCVLSDGCLSSADIAAIVERKGESIREQGLLEYYPTQSNEYELGGFDNVRSWLRRARVGFSERARELNLTPPRGILLVGVQGCGKSLAAKYVAREWNLPLLKLDAGRLFDKYVGESEKNFRKAVLQAESMAPVVLWIDEIEKSFSSFAGGEADGGLGMRILGSFLTWMQEKRQEVFVVATANDLSSLPPELLRKGRFDEIFFVDLPNGAQRKAIFAIHLRLRKQNPEEFDLDDLVAKSEGFSGAEIEQVVISALYQSLHRRDLLQTDTLLAELAATIPLSVARGEEIEDLRAWAKQRFVSAG